MSARRKSRTAFVPGVVFGVACAGSVVPACTRPRPSTPEQTQPPNVIVLAMVAFDAAPPTPPAPSDAAVVAPDASVVAADATAEAVTTSPPHMFVLAMIAFDAAAAPPPPPAHDAGTPRRRRGAAPQSQDRRREIQMMHGVANLGFGAHDDEQPS